MKKIFPVLAFFTLGLAVRAVAQDEGDNKPFKAEVALGYALPLSGIGSSGGFLFAAEPKYAVLPQLSVGIRFEAAITVSGISSNSSYYDDYYDNYDASANTAVSFLGTADYYFSKKNFKPFAGVGAGIYRTQGVDLGDGEGENTGSGSNFGGMIRGGIEFKHLRAALEYNIVSKTSVAAYTDQYGDPYDAYDIKNAYIGVKIGVLIGGGRR